MPKLVWDQVGQRKFETGCSHGIYFKQLSEGGYSAGVAWNGLTSVKMSPDGAEAKPFYADNVKYIQIMSAENTKGSIEAYTYPQEFAESDGMREITPGAYISQQSRTGFALVYSTVVGNDTEGIEHGEKIHFIWNARVSPSERSYETINEDVNAITFSWEFSTTPESATGYKPTAYMEVDTSLLAKDRVTALKELIYGSESKPSTMPTVDELIALLKQPGV